MNLVIFHLSTTASVTRCSELSKFGLAALKPVSTIMIGNPRIGPSVCSHFDGKVAHGFEVFHELLMSLMGSYKLIEMIQ